MATFTSFGGIIPRTPDHALPLTNASIAHNVKLRNGKIEAWRERRSWGLAVADALSMYVYNCGLYSWDTCTSVTKYLPDYKRHYITGRNDYPEVFTIENNTLAYQYLGVPNPTSVLSVVAPTNTGNTNSASRNYVYTYVNNFGEESGPSLPSRSIIVEDGTTVLLSGIATPTPGYGVVGVNIYRSATGQRTGDEGQQELVTVYRRVAALELPVTSYSDSIIDLNLGPALSTRECRLPPAALRHITTVEGTGTMVGVTNNRVYFTRDFRPYDWPAANEMVLPHNIVNMKTLDRFVFVSTDSVPYVIDGQSTNQPRQCRPVEDVNTKLPDIGCGYTDSACITPFGMVYSSPDGLVLVNPRAEYQIITSSWFSTDDWKDLRPETVRLVYWRGYVVCVTDVVSFLLEIDAGSYNDVTIGALSTFSDTPQALYVSDNNELLMLDDQFVYQWDAGDTLRPYQWRSRNFTWGGGPSPIAGKVRTTGTNITLHSIDTNEEDTVFVYNEKPFRFARLGRSYEFWFEVQGTETVDFVDIGTMYTTVNSGA